MGHALAFVFLLIPILSSASPAEEPRDDRIPLLDRAQEFFGTQANVAANRLDSFFATERADDEFGRSRIRIRSRFEIRELQRSDLSTQYRINLKLPALEEKFRFSFQKDQREKRKKEKEAQAERTPEQIAEEERRKQEQETKLFKGWLFNSDVGVSLAIPPRLVTRARLRKNLRDGRITHRFAEQLIYTTFENGLTDETQIDSDYQIRENILFRFVNSKSWRILQKEFTTAHGPTILHQFSDNEAFSYSFIASSIVEKGVWYVTNYQLSTTYRRNMYRQWVYVNVVPGLDFPKFYSFRRNPFIFFQIEFLFGSS
jgi:hypothetical protein